MGAVELTLAAKKFPTRIAGKKERIILNMWKKRVIAICMILSMLVALLPETPAVAAGSDSEYMDIGSCGTNMTYVLGKDGVLRIAGDGEMTDFTSASAVP